MKQQGTATIRWKTRRGKFITSARARVGDLTLNVRDYNELPEATFWTVSQDEPAIKMRMPGLPEGGCDFVSVSRMLDGGCTSSIDEAKRLAEACVYGRRAA